MRTSPTHAAHSLSVRLRAITLLLYNKPIVLSMAFGNINTFKQRPLRDGGDFP